MEDQVQASPRRSRKSLRALIWVALASLLAVGLLGTSSAGALVATATDAHQTLPISWNAPAYQGDDEECAGLNLPPGYILWHFVLTQTAATSGMLTVQFDWVNVNYVVLSSKKTGGTLHFNVITTGGGATLTAASTNVTGKNLNLSHICSNVPTTTTSSSTTESTTTVANSSTSASTSATN